VTADLLAVMNRRAAADAVRAEAARAGLDADQLLDSARFYATVTALDPDASDFGSRVRELVGAVASAPAALPAAVASTAPAPAPAASAGPVQWTDDDVSRSSPAELAAAVEAGQLTSLGWPPRRQRTRG
jgi:hypothetical protein